MADPQKPEEHPVRTLPSRNLGDTALDMSQPDGIPVAKETPPKGPDGKFISTKPAEPEKKAHEHSASLIGLAQDYGIDQEDIDELDSEALTRMIRVVRKRDGALQASHSRDTAANNSMERKPVPPPEPEPEPEIDLGIDEEAFGPELVGAMKKIAKTSEKRIRDLEKSLAAEKAQNDARSIQQATLLTEEAFEAISTEYPDLFGKGSIDQIKAKDPDAHYRRLMLFNRAGADPRLVSGKVLLEKLREAIPKLFPGAAAKKEEKNPYEEPITEAAARAGANGGSRPTKREWQSAGSAIPTHRSDSHEPKGAEAATKTLERKIREEGGANSEEQREDEKILGTLKRNK